jgi:hypothetical protein
MWGCPNFWKQDIRCKYTETSVAETSGSLRPHIASHAASPDSDSDADDCDFAALLKAAMEQDQPTESAPATKLRR